VVPAPCPPKAQFGRSPPVPCILPHPEKQKAPSISGPAGFFVEPCGPLFLQQSWSIRHVPASLRGGRAAFGSLVAVQERASSFANPLLCLPTMAAPTRLRVGASRECGSSLCEVEMWRLAGEMWFGVTCAWGNEAARLLVGPGSKHNLTGNSHNYDPTAPAATAALESAPWRSRPTSKLRRRHTKAVTRFTPEGGGRR
jgi:hypothetical protein